MIQNLSYTFTDSNKLNIGRYTLLLGGGGERETENSIKIKNHLWRQTRVLLFKKSNSEKVVCWRRSGS